MLNTGPRVVFLKLGPRYFPLFPSLKCFWACLKTQIVSIGAKIAFSQSCRDVKKKVIEKRTAFFVLSSLCCMKTNRKREKHKHTHTQWKRAKEDS